MKKIIAILLVLVIGFSVFAETGAGVTRLNLSSSVDGTLYHGFSNTALNRARIKNNLSVDDSGGVWPNPIVSAPVDMTSANAQSIGFYGFYITDNSQATVTIGTNNRLSTTTPTSDLWEVPYALSFVETVSEGPRVSSFVVDASTMGTASTGAINTGTATGRVSQTLITASGSGLGVKAYRLYATFIGASNEDLPQGSYAGSIIATVVAP